MRLDDLPQSDNIEDRRGDSGGGGGGGFPMGMGGRGGLGIGTIVVLGIIGYALGIDPRLLIGGAEMFSGGSARSSRRRAGRRARPARRATTWASSSARMLGSADVQWKLIFEQARPALPRADAGDVRRRDARRCVRAGAVRDGPVLLPGRPEDLSRHLVLPRHRAPLQGLRRGLEVVPVRAGLRDRARGRPPRAEPARHPAEGAAAAARPEQGRGEPHPGAGRAAGRLLRRRLGQQVRPAVEVHRAGRRRGRDEDRGRDRRRPAAEAGAGLRHPGLVHARLVGAAPALVQHRAEAGHGRGLQHLRGGRAARMCSDPLRAPYAARQRLSERRAMPGIDEPARSSRSRSRC